MDAGLTVPAAQMTVDKDMTITTSVWWCKYHVKCRRHIGASDAKAKFCSASPTNFASTFRSYKTYKMVLQFTLLQQATVFVDDVVWRKAITKIMIGSTDVTDKVTITAGLYVFVMQMVQSQTMPSKITFPGSLFPTATNYTMTVKATGYQDVTKALRFRR